MLKNEAGRTESLRTGVVTRTFESTTVRALVQPATRQRDFVYDISYLAANKNFVYGGVFDKTLVEVTVRSGDLPSGFRVDTKTLVFIENEAYIVRSCESDMSEGGFFYRLVVKRTDSPDIAQVVISGIRATYTLTAVNPVVVIS